MDGSLGTLFVLSCVLCLSSAQNRCILSRLDHVDCPYRDVHMRARSNEFTIHHTKLNEGGSGFVKCNVKKKNQKRLEITDLGTDEMRIIYSSGFTIGESYDNQLLMEYNVKCGENELTFFNVTDIDLEGKTCRDKDRILRCQDYIQIRRGSFGITELCGNTTLENEVGSLEGGNLIIHFRTSETTRKSGFRMFVVCFKPEEKEEDDCFRADEFNSSVCGNSSGSGMDFQTDLIRDMMKRSAEDNVMEDVLDSHGFRMRRDLVEFHNKWQRMRRQAVNIRFVERNILHSETVLFTNGNISIFDEDGENVEQYTGVRVLETFDAEGTQRGFMDSDDGTPTPGPGPLYIVGQSAYFQLFVIDPRGIIPDEQEAMELQRMNEQMLNSVPSANDPNVTDPDQTIDPLFIPGLLDERRRRGVGNEPEALNVPEKTNERKRRQLIDETATAVDEQAVFAALRNRRACNPVLRAQSRATLKFFSGINSTAVDALRTFPMKCIVSGIQLSCSTESITLPGRTLCSINDGEPIKCDAALEAPLDIEELRGLTSYTLTVTAINCNGQTAEVIIEIM